MEVKAAAGGGGGDGAFVVTFVAYHVFDRWHDPRKAEAKIEVMVVVGSDGGGGFAAVTLILRRMTSGTVNSST